MEFFCNACELADCLCSRNPRLSEGRRVGSESARGVVLVLSLASMLLLGAACDSGVSEADTTDVAPASDAVDIGPDAASVDVAADLPEMQCDNPEPGCQGNSAYVCEAGQWVEADCGQTSYCSYNKCIESGFTLPKDGAAHQNIIEWWYYTGHVDDGTNFFGFELALFQQDLEQLLAQPVSGDERFGFMCHVALLDKNKKEHAYTHSIATKTKVWTSDPIEMHVMTCYLQLSGDGHDHIVGEIPEGDEKKGKEGAWKFDLNLDAVKPVAHHGVDGIIPMAEAGDSYYYSFTRMDVSGEIETPDGVYDVSGQGWMDHQWGDFETMHFKGWDWWSMQFEDGWEIMLFQFRDWDDVLVERSGTLVDPDGNLVPLDGLDAFDIKSLRTWSSTWTDGVYPLDWDITIKELDWVLAVRTDVDDQEVPNLAKNYWEGAVTISGTRSGAEVSGHGYVELTGYATDIMGPK